MNNYELDQDEVVIISEYNAQDDYGTVDLVLTNHNIIQSKRVSKGLFKSEEVTEKYPLIKLKENKGKPNVIVGKSPNGTTRLELYFEGYEKHYIFKGVFTEKKWAGLIEKTYKACVTEQKKHEKDKAKANKGSIFSPVKEKFDGARKTITEKTNQFEERMLKCPKCGAEIVGKKGDEVKCEYCDTVVKIK